MRCAWCGTEHDSMEDAKDHGPCPEKPTVREVLDT